MENKGKLIGIARAAVPLGPLEELPDADIAVESGIAGDVRGKKKSRQISILFREDWEAACGDVPALAGRTLPWTTRRANLYVEGLQNPKRLGGHIAIGAVVLEIVCETEPCDLMDKAQAGLKAAMTPNWRGGVCCKVIRRGAIKLGDVVKS